MSGNYFDTGNGTHFRFQSNTYYGKPVLSSTNTAEISPQTAVPSYSEELAPYGVIQRLPEIPTHGAQFHVAENPTEDYLSQTKSTLDPSTTQSTTLDAHPTDFSQTSATSVGAVSDHSALIGGFPQANRAVNHRGVPSQSFQHSLNDYQLGPMSDTSGYPPGPSIVQSYTEPTPARPPHHPGATSFQYHGEQAGLAAPSRALASIAPHRVNMPIVDNSVLETKQPTDVPERLYNAVCQLELSGDGLTGKQIQAVCEALDLTRSESFRLLNGPRSIHKSRPRLPGPRRVAQTRLTRPSQKRSLNNSEHDDVDRGLRKGKQRADKKKRSRKKRKVSVLHANVTEASNTVTMKSIREEIIRYCKTGIKSCVATMSDEQIEDNRRQAWDSTKRYSCLFLCGRTFRKASDWKRHEHNNRPVVVWVCMHGSCHEKPIELKLGRATRMFLREDKFCGHLQESHPDLQGGNYAANARFEIPDNFERQCGFCGLNWQSFDARLSHIAEHFRKGKTMADWKMPWHDHDAAFAGEDSEDDDDDDDDDDNQDDGSDADTGNDSESHDNGYNDDDDDAQDDGSDTDIDDIGDYDGDGSDDNVEHDNSANLEEEEIKENQEDIDRNVFEDGNGIWNIAAFNNVAVAPEQSLGSFQLVKSGPSLARPGNLRITDCLRDIRDLSEFVGRYQSNKISQMDFNQVQKSGDMCTILWTQTWSEPWHVERLKRSDISSDSLLGEGAHSLVDHISMKDRGIQLARKRIQRRGFSHDQKWERFLKEATITAFVQHPHIVKLRGIFLADQECSILIEPAASFTLRQFLSSNNRCSTTSPYLGMEDLGCIAEGLSYLHRLRVQHGDIKPENMLYHHSVASSRWLICDFGSSSVSSDAKPTEFTPRYVAPEVVQGGAISEASDVWSLGCVFFEVLLWYLSEGSTCGSKDVAWPKTSTRFHSSLSEVSEWLDRASKLQSNIPNVGTDGFSVMQINFLRTMLNPNLSLRPSVRSVVQIFPPRACCSTATYSPPSVVLRHPAGEQSSSLRGCLAEVSLRLKTCERTHKSCQIATKLVPTRVIDIRSGSVINPSSEKPCRYAALSYCWGTSGVLQNAVKSFRTDRLHKTLPKTIRDAIEITQALGISYLWVDAICIVQDSCEDWAREASMMGTVYGNASVTIVASGAEDCTQGIFRAQKNYKLLNAPLESTNGMMYSSFPWHDWDAPCSSVPRWSTRAWCFQEILLSRRVLNFTSQSIIWWCSSLDFRGEIQEVAGKQLGNLRLLLKQTTMGSNLAMAEALEAWYACVESYSSRHLTFTSDKLPAISGLARTFATTIQGSYIAGLWNKDLINGLAWRVRWPLDDPDQGFKTRKVCGRAPTWSWASMDGTIMYDFPLFMPEPSSISQNKRDKKWRRPILDKLLALNGSAEFVAHQGAGDLPEYLEATYQVEKAICRIVRVEISSASSDPFGMVSGGKLVVEAVLRKARWEPAGWVPEQDDAINLSNTFWLIDALNEHNEVPEGQPHDNIRMTRRGTRPFAKCVFDDNTDRPLVVDCLVLQAGQGRVRGLIVSKNDADETFRRVGYFCETDIQYQNLAWLGETETIEII